MIEHIGTPQKASYAYDHTSIMTQRGCVAEHSGASATTVSDVREVCSDRDANGGVVRRGGQPSTSRLAQEWSHIHSLFRNRKDCLL